MGKWGKNMVLAVLIGVLVLAVGGCVCVVWASRGGPAWVRAVAKVTLLGGELVRDNRKRSRTQQGDGGTVTGGGE
ncbi:hypothetical protein GCM10017674_64950 [Streptomyces gardneri]|uniref:Lipoprotein n=2 Tax=Streptomyces gardneri TaxID=66892 RepID=A0A4Y3RTY9_9ACTN|nr:hypothetical protein SGA01_63940 [Streptomyces gardneri]GHH15626.1 hypothetical protein GCM10017674_64950 [Streptomyces gardneri]